MWRVFEVGPPLTLTPLPRGERGPRSVLLLFRGPIARVMLSFSTRTRGCVLSSDRR